MVGASCAFFFPLRSLSGKQDQRHTHIFTALNFQALLDQCPKITQSTLATALQCVLFKCAFSPAFKYVGLLLKQRHHEKIAGLRKDWCAVSSLVGGLFGPLPPAPLASAITVSTGDSWPPKKGSDNPTQLNPLQLFPPRFPTCLGSCCCCCTHKFRFFTGG